MEDIEVKFEDAVVSEDNSEVVSQRRSGPLYGKDGWQEYVLSQLGADEAVKTSDGKVYPKCAGLRRLAELLLGDIVFMGPTKIFPADGNGEGPGRASVLAEVHIVWTRANNSAIDVFDNSDLKPRIFADASDVWEGNCAKPYVFHALATATTKAISRALKNALCLNIHTAEEMAGNPEYQSTLDKPLEKIVEEATVSPLSQQQLRFIESIASKIDVDHNKVSQSMFSQVTEKLSKSQASDVIKKIQGLQNATSNGESIPDDFRN